MGEPTRRDRKDLPILLPKHTEAVAQEKSSFPFLAVPTCLKKRQPKFILKWAGKHKEGPEAASPNPSLRGNVLPGEERGTSKEGPHPPIPIADLIRKTLPGAGFNELELKT